MVDDRLVAFVNGRRVYEEAMEKYNIEPVGTSMVRVRLLNLMVHFDGYTARIYMRKHMTEDQCGLCGHSDDECGVEENYSREKNHYGLKEHEDSEETIEDWPDVQEGDRNHRDDKRLHRNRFEGKSEEKEEVYPIHQDPTAAILERTHVIEAAHGVCFSLEPVPVCRENEQMSTVINRKVSFTCLPRSSSEARQLLHKASSNALDLKHYPISFVESIQVPLTCTVY
ncbi:unnamed protein product [Haemonchus placei]|uniref:VWFD domain-containing protein n=1 Tax=Haemonchus placei TaxID=6290 RepID=A0A0N4WR18_HAEPC|nr:unnamed protein product [Haemonchus placei]